MNVQAMNVAEVLGRIRPFLGASQFEAIRRFCNGEEGEWYREAVARIDETIAKMPLPYTTDGQGEDAIVHLHYFCSGWDWFLTEKDSEPDQMQTFGLVAGLETELGYICIPEVTGVGAELDLHWTPKPLSEVRASLPR